MSLFSRMFGTTEKEETPATHQPEQSSELTHWPFLTLPMQPGDAAPELAALARDAPLAPAEVAAPAAVVRALPTIVVRTPVPPPPPRAAAPPKTEESIDIELDLAELDLDSMAAATSTPPVASPRDGAADRQANATRFGQLAGEQAPALRELMATLALGSVSKRSLEQTKPAVVHMLGAARRLEQSQLASLLASFDVALTAATKGHGPKVTDRDRDALLAAYSRLARALPRVFDLTSEREQREPLVVHYLLRQVPGVHQLTIDKLRAAGFGSLEALCRCSVADLVASGHIDGARAEAISRHVRNYHSERAERWHERITPRLHALLERLARAHAEYEHADAVEARPKKRSAGNERRAASLQLSLLLSQIGEIELVEGLERSPTERKIEIVRRYLDGSAGSALGQRT